MYGYELSFCKEKTTPTFQISWIIIDVSQESGIVVLIIEVIEHLMSVKIVKNKEITQS